MTNRPGSDGLLFGCISSRRRIREVGFEAVVAHRRCGLSRGGPVLLAIQIMLRRNVDSKEFLARSGTLPVLSQQFKFSMETLITVCENPAKRWDGESVYPVSKQEQIGESVKLNKAGEQSSERRPATAPRVRCTRSRNYAGIRISWLADLNSSQEV